MALNDDPHQHHQLGTVRFQDDGMISVNIWPRWSNGPWITVTSIVVSLSMDRWIIVAGDFYCRFIASSFILRFFIFTFKPTWFALSHRSRSTGQFFLFNFIFFFHEISSNWAEFSAGIVDWNLISTLNFIFHLKQTNQQTICFWKRWKKKSMTEWIGVRNWHGIERTSSRPTSVAALSSRSPAPFARRRPIRGGGPTRRKATNQTTSVRHWNASIHWNPAAS